MTAARPGREALFEQFAADGIDRMFGNPGTVEQGFLDAASGVPDFGYVLALQETVAVAMADGYARARQAPALVQLHSGVGLGNAVGMLYQAKRGHSPLIAVAGESGVRYDAMDAQMAADLVAMARPVTKYATRVVHPGSVLRVLRRAVKIAMTPPRGPVFVALPMDVLDELTDEPAVPSSVPSRRTVPVPDEVERAAAALRGARRPLILLGDGVAVSNAQDELTALAELLGAPVYGVDCSEVNIDTTHPLWRGQLGHMFGESSARVVREADAVLIVGTYVFPEVFPRLDNPFRDGTPIVHIDLDDFEVAKNFPVTVGLIADPKPTLYALTALLAADRPVPPPQLDSWQLPVPAADASPLEAFAYQLARQSGGDLVVFDEALTASPVLARYLPARQPGSFFQTRGGSLGVGIPGAIGAKLARPDQQVVGFTGDGGSMYTIQALWTAARHDVAAKFVICNNHRYRLLDQNIEQYWLERGIAPHTAPEGFDLSHPALDFTTIAGGLGVPGLRVEKADDAEEAVTRLLAADGPFLVDLLTD